MANIKKVMRLNQTVSCSGCYAMVNPYVIERRHKELTIKLECPNCEHVWSVDFKDETRFFIESV